MKIKYQILFLAALTGLLTAVNPAFAQNWMATSAPSNIWSSIASSADGTRLVAVAGGPAGSGLIYASADSGTNWVATSAPSAAWNTVTSSRDGIKLAAAVYGGTIYTSTDSGVTWTPTSAPNALWTSIASSLDGTGLVAAAYLGSTGTNGAIYASANSGATWTKTSAPSDRWNAVASSADGTKLAAAAGNASGIVAGPIYTSVDSGVTWAASTAPNEVWNSVALSADGTNMAAAGKGIGENPQYCYLWFVGWYFCGYAPYTTSGPIFISTNSGTTWSNTSAPSQFWNSIASSANGTRLAAASSGAIYTSADAGSTWTPASAPATNWSAIASSAHGNKLAAVVSGGLIYTWNIRNLFIITQPASQTVPGGTSVALGVTVSGAAPLIYQWQENGTNLIGATNAMLTLTNLALSDSGNYAVLVTNNYNSVLSSNSLLTVLPAVVTTLPATGASYNQATFNGTVTSGSNQTFVWFQWGTDTNYGNMTPAMTVTNGLPSVSFSASVAGLTPGMDYHCQAVASNLLGIAVGADIAFDTKTNPPALAFTIATPGSSLGGVAVDGLGNIYASDYVNEQVMRFSKNGAYATEWFSGSGYSSYGGMGVAVSTLNNIFVADSYAQIIRSYNGAGRPFTSWGSSGSGNGQFQGLNYIAAGASIYVSDSGNFRIQKFSTGGAYQAQWGSQGTNNGQFGYGTSGIAVDGSNNVYVADSGNYRIQKFSSSGAYLTQWGGYGGGPGQFYYPASVAADSSNNVYVLDGGYYSPRIEKFSQSGAFLTQWILPSNGNYTGMAVDRPGNFIYVTDSSHNQILVFVNDLSIVAPLILSQPVSQTVTVGASVTFSASAFGGNPLAYQWQAHGTNLPAANNNSVTLAAVGLADAGAYRVVVTNSAGTTTSSNATLSVVAGFATTQPANGISAVSATLNGMATASVDNTTAWFQWDTNSSYSNVAGGASLPASGNVTAVAATVTGLVNDYTYHFRLVVSNAYGVAYGADQQFVTGRKVFLSGNYPDFTTAGLTNIVAIAAGNTLGFGIRNDGTVASWGTPYYSGTSFPTGLSNIVAISVGAAQTTALKSDGTAIFWGSGTSGTATLPGLTNLVAVSIDLALKSDGSVVAWAPGATNVSAIPGWTNIVAIAEGYQDAIALRNDGTVIDRFGYTTIPSGLNNVVAIATGGDSYHGQYYLALKGNGTVVSWGYDPGIPVGLINLEAISCYEFKSALSKSGSVFSWTGTSLYPDVPATLGNVVAIASWQAGTVVLASQTYPASVTLAATQIMTNGATLNASINPSGANTTAWFVWGTNSYYGQMTSSTPLGNASSPISFSNNLSGLTPNTTYHCQVIASNFLGVVAGTDVAFVTAGPPFATTGAAIPVTTTDTGINGLVTPNELSTTAWFEWGTNSSYGNVTAVTNIGSGTVPVPVGNLLSGLDPSVVWHFRVVASNSVGVATGADHVFGGPHYGYAATVLADQPLIYYRFEETGGPTAINSGTLGSAGDGMYNTNVTLGNPSISVLFGGAAGFNGVSSGVAVPASTTQTQLTVEAWLRPGSFPYFAEIYAQDQLGYGGWALQMNGSQLDLVVLGNSPQDTTFGDQTMLFVGQWVQVAATYDSVAKTMVGYINGLPIATNKYSTAFPALWTPAHLGQYSGQNFLNGLMDEFAIYDHALPADRILAHYNAASGAVLPTLLTTLPASGITADGAILNGSAKIVPVETLAWFDWGTDTNYGNITGITDLSANSSMVTISNALNGLDGALTYHYRLVASNAFGIESGADQSFMVGLAPIAYDSPLAGNTSNSAILNCVINPGGLATTVYFQWGTFGGGYPNRTPAIVVPPGISQLTNVTSLITNLVSAGAYQSQVVASNRAGLTHGQAIGFLTAPYSTAPLQVWTGLALSADGTHLAASSAGGLWHTGGATWFYDNSGSWTTLASSADGTKLVAVGIGKVYTTTNGGDIWISNSLPPLNWTAVASSADGTKLAAVGTFKVYTTTNGGNTWVSNSLPLLNWAAVASSADGMSLAALGSSKVYTSTNGGSTWLSNNLPAQLWGSIACSADGTRLMATSYLGVFTSTDGGGTWISNPTPPNTSWGPIVISADGSKWAVACTTYGSTAGIYISQSTPTPLLSLTTSGSDAFVSWIIPSQDFTLQQSSDLANWTDVTAPPVLNLTNLQNQVPVSPTNTAGFYRLNH